MTGQQDDSRSKHAPGVSRRKFLSLSKNAAVVGMLANVVWIDEARAAIPASTGYLLVDTKKCQGCVSCMLACSLVHEGTTNLSLSRIQVLQNSFLPWPHDLTIEQCRQCVEAACVVNCPVEALRPDPEFGNVRTVNKEECIGCGTCVEECPHTPSRPILAEDEEYDGDLKSRKCDLCAGAPHHWHDKGGGPDGMQACVAVCPVGAIRFVATIPRQDGDEGYKVNLRGRAWRRLGYPID